MKIYFSVLSDIFSSKDFSNETTEYHLHGARMSQTSGPGRGLSVSRTGESTDFISYVISGMTKYRVVQYGPMR